MSRSRHPAKPASRSEGRSEGRPDDRPGGRRDARPDSGHGGRGNAGSDRAPAGGALLLYGVHAVAAAWTNPERRCRSLLATDAGMEALASAVAAAKAAGLERPQPRLVDKTELDRKLPSGAVHQGLALDAAPLPETGIEDICRAAETQPNLLVLVLDQVTDPHNVGAILRSASAFGAGAVVITDRNAPEATGTLAKSASGALESVPLVRVGNLARAIDLLKQAGLWCVGLDESGQRTLSELDLTGRTALVLGAEGSGIRRLTAERCDEVARLPTGGPVASLNVSAAAAVALYEVARRR
jgi:23S rRNA (guanosine2251-2'-O)-methyltransferase